MGSERVAWVDAARGLAIALVVLHHSAQRSVNAGSADGWTSVTQMVATVRLPLLFTVAGLFAVGWITTRRWRALLAEKVLLFGWVFVLWLVLRHLWFLLSPLPDAGIGTPALPDLAAQLWSPRAGWFIYALALVFVIAKAAHRCRVPPALQLAVTATTSVLCTSGTWVIENQVWDGIASYLVFFLVGVHLRDQLLSLGRVLDGRLGAVVVVVWALGYVALDAADLERSLGFSFMLRLAGVAAGVSVAVAVQRLAPLRRLGQGTMPVYMVHPLIVISIVRVVGAVHDVGSDPVSLLAMPVLVTAVALPVAYAVGQVAPKVGLRWLFATPLWARSLAAGDRSPVHRHDARRTAPVHP